MKTETGSVNVEVTNAKGEKTTVSKQAEYVQLENAEDVLTLASDAEKVKDLISAANYGFNLKSRAAVRQSILNEAAGPGKAIEQMVKSLVKMTGMSEDTARARVLSNLAAMTAAA